MKAFRDLIRDREIAVVGNAQSLLEGHLGHAIDDCDVVIRMNRGTVVDPRAQGRRTDILVTSIPLEVSFVLDAFSPAVVMWATSKRRLIPESYHENRAFEFVVHPLWHWWRLRWRLGSRPSTGAILLNYIYLACDPKVVRIAGFDHFASGSFYETRADIGPHSPKAEERYMRKMYQDKRFVNVQSSEAI